MKDIYGIGIETSCDETSVSLVKNGNEVIKNLVYTQIDLHSQYGGVVPEIASRAHLEKIPYLLQEIINLGIEPNYISVTNRPGLTGSLLIGYNTALALSLHIKKPVIPINHLEAHLYASKFSGYTITYPYIGLLVSGGNTALYKITSLGKIEVIGDTFDDACGEALDKAAQLLKLPYPGGPYIEKYASSFLDKQMLLEKEYPNQKKEAMRNPFPKIMTTQKENEFNFSFSGLKTSLLYTIQKQTEAPNVEYLCYHYQMRIIEAIVTNTVKACNTYKINKVVAAGGVMANKTLRSRLHNELKLHNTDLHIPPIEYCGDNGAMIAALGYEYFKQGSWEPYSGVFSKPLFKT